METAQSITQQLNPFDWVVSYFHIPVNQAHRKFVWFSIMGITYQFKAMYFVLFLAPLGIHKDAKTVYSISTQTSDLDTSIDNVTSASYLNSFSGRSSIAWQTSTDSP